MEQSQLQQLPHVQPLAEFHHQMRQRPPDNQRQHGGYRIEHHMRQSQPLAVAVPAQHTHQRSGCAAADVGADGNGKTLYQADLPSGQCRQGQQQRGVGGLQHHGQQKADDKENQYFGHAADLRTAEINVRTESLKTGLDFVHTEENQCDADQNPAKSTAAVAEKTHQDAEYQHRQGGGAEAQALPGQSQQPNPAGRAQIGAEQNGDTAGKLNHAGA